MTEVPTPQELWAKAHGEYPRDFGARRRRYRELMREHRYLVAGAPKPLPCGWPREESDVHD